jgi:hypothetical protein
MRMNLRTLAFIALTVIASRSAIAQELSPKPLLIRDVTVIDFAGNAPLRDMSILISNGLIAAIGPSSEKKPSPDTEILDAHGKYLIPGLWNMHVHLGAYADGKRSLSAFLEEGVVGVRDMGSPLDDILRLRQETDDGTIFGPRMVVAGPIIQGPLPFQIPVFVSVKDAAEGRETVQMLKRRGVDFIKVQDAIPHDIYVAVADQARLEQIPFVGHIAPTVLPEEASDLGQRSVEHLGGLFWTILVGASTRESELHAEEVQMYNDALAAQERKERTPHPNMDAQFTRKVLETYDVRKATALIARFIKNDTWQCPTLVVLHWAVDGDKRYTGEDLVWADRIIAKDTELVAMMQKAGVGLLAGTDLPPNAKNGTIHDELAALVDAGLAPIQALETATRGPAKFLGKLASSGTVEKGKVADLVLLNDNPLDDIHNTTHISAVILRGRLISH